MTTYAWPSDLPVANVALYLDPNTRDFISQYTRSVSTIDIPGERWLASIRLGSRSAAKAPRVEAIFNRLRGSGLLSLWHFGHPTPYGTMRGAPTLNAAALQGASSFQIATTAGSGINSIEDLRDKSVSVGSPGSGTEVIWLTARHHRSRLVPMPGASSTKPCSASWRRW